MVAAYLIAIASATMGQTSTVSHTVTFSDDLQSPGRLAPAPGGGVYVTDQAAGRVLEYAAGGGAPTIYDVPEEPVGLAYRPDLGDGGRVLVSLANGTIGVYSAGLVPVVGSSFLGVLDEPNDMAMYPYTTDAYQVFVIDSGASQVVVFQEGPLDTWAEVNRFSTDGSGLGETVHPQAITVDAASGMVIVTDVDNFRAQVFDTSGFFQYRFGHRMFYGGWGVGEFAWFARSEGVATDTCGNIYISDALMGTVRVFDPTGGELDVANPAVSYGTAAGEVRIPIDIAIEGGKLFVASSYNSAVEVYDVACTLAAMSPSAESGLATIGSDREIVRRADVRGKVVRAPATPDNPLDILATIDSGAYNRRSDLNLDRTVDYADLQVAIDAFGVGTLDDFLAVSGGVADASFHPPHVLDTPDACGRCHGMNELPGGMLSAGGQENLCLSCHTGGGLAMDMPISGSDKGLAHPIGIPADQGVSMGPDPDGLLAQHLDAGDIKCSTCHDQHNRFYDPYLRNSVGNAYLCGECHTEAAEWENAGHGDPEGEAFVHYDWTGSNRSSCRKCHSGLGFIDWSNGLANADQRGDEHVHSCVVCHGVHENGNAELLRVTGEVTLPGDIVVNAGTSASCLECHNGRRDPSSGSLTPHYLLGGVMLEGINGAEFGNTSLSNSMHTLLTECTDCHMADSPAAGNPGAGKVGGHSFNMTLHDAEDLDDGFENVVNACGSCHAGLPEYNRTALGDYDGDSVVEGVQDEVQGLLDLVFAQIHAKGAVFLGHYPYWSLAGLDYTGATCNGGLDDGLACAGDGDCDRDVLDDGRGDCLAADEPMVRDAIWNFEYVDNDGSLGVHNTSYAVGLLQLTSEELSGAVIAGALLRYTPEGTTLTADYIGTDTCLSCHGAAAVTGTDYTMFLNNGHSYKLNEIVDGQVPTYPFSTILGALGLIADDDDGAGDGIPTETDNTLGTPLDYNDISFVIGGFGWKSRWIDSDGFIVTGSEVQYNLETTGMVAYHNNETDKKYDCGNCHTTGWKRYTSEAGDTRNLNRQNGLAGMEGTFAAPGVHCEACHGAGSLHAFAPSTANITLLATPRETADFLAPDMAYGKAAACSDCHTRDGEKDYPTYVSGPGRIVAKGGLIKHHEQYDEMIGIDPDDVAGGSTGPHRNLSCMACHDPHTTTRYMDISGDAPGMNKDCTACHNAGGLGGKDYAITSGGMTGLDCKDCHMPKLAKSAVAHAAVGTGPITGDIMSHIFRIDLAQTDQFTGDGAFAYPRITGDFACKTCHNGVDAFDMTFPVAITIHPAP